MITVYSGEHRQHHGVAELDRGCLVPCVEQPARAEAVLRALTAANLGPIVAPHDVSLDMSLDLLRRVHDSGYVDFLHTAFARWQHPGDALPYCWPPGGRSQAPPPSLHGQLGHYAYDASTPITAGTWEAATAAVRVTLTALRRLHAGARMVFALCRPPGHHAGPDYYGGYCFFNNAALAAQAWVEAGARVAVLDVDYHHGNGTQDLFYRRDDVLFVSIHADPAEEYPFYCGHADERGEGPGRGYNHNFPLPLGTGWPLYQRVLSEALDLIATFEPDGLVVSLGFDTYAQDPIARFSLQSGDYPLLGRAIATLNLPTLFVLEGGYHLATLGHHAVAVLQSFALQAATSRPSSRW